MRFLRDPLLHFALLGALLFAVYQWIGAPGKEEPRGRILVDDAVIESLEQGFQAVWKRQPNEAERTGLIEDYIAEQLLYREALRLGLDEGDVVIRRRLRQKMEFLLQDQLAQLEPSETELAAFYEENAQRYRRAPRLSFVQVYLGSGAGGDAAEALLVKLREGGDLDVDALGQPSLLPRVVRSENAGAVGRLFGEEFAQALLEGQTGVWFGPVPSSYGEHLVLLEEREEGRLPPLDEVRGDVLRDYRFQKGEETQAALIERLKENYDIVLPEDAGQ